jgi:hypothetical protein
MQDKRVEIGAVGPYDRSKLIIDTNLCEEVGVAKRLEDRTVQLSTEIDIAGATIAEAQPQTRVV